MNTITRFSFAVATMLCLSIGSFARNNDVKGPPCSLTTTTSTLNNVQCNGGSNGSARALPSGGTTPYTYSWSPSGGTKDTAANLSAGIYTVTVTDAASCTATATAFISQPTKLTLSLINDTVCGTGCIGTLSGSLSGGTPFYTYLWSNAQTASMTSALCTGTYTLTGTDGNGCSVTASAEAVVESNISGATITPTIVSSTCPYSLDGSISLSVSGPSAPFRYAWEPYANKTIYGNNTFNNVGAGTYTVTISDKYNSCTVYTYTVNSANNCNTIYGKAFNDTNFNCTYNVGESGLSDSYITITPGSYIVNPDAYGDFSQYLPYGTYTVTQTMFTGSPFAACSSSQIAVVNTSSPTVYFADTTHTPLQDPMITYLYSSPFVTGDSCSSQFQLKNNGSVASSGKVYFTIGDSLKLISTSPAYSSYSHDTVYWNYSGLAPSSTINYTINCLADTSVYSGFLDCIIAGVQPIGTESNVENDINGFCVLFADAMDPNDKAVSPPGIGPNGDIQISDSVLTYIIRFQNTGTATAQNIFIVDTISNYLNVNTLQVLGASNNYSYTVTGNRVRFTFNNINLPDSAANPNGSKGWIEYQVHQSKSNTIGDVIHNTGYIYFDYNPAVVTNTTINTIYSPAGVQTIAKPADDMKIYPNPANDEVYLSYTLGNTSHVQVNVLDMLGRIVYTNNLGSKPAGQQQEAISVKSIAQGSYILQLKTDTSVLNKKLDIIR